MYRKDAEAPLRKTAEEGPRQDGSCRWISTGWPLRARWHFSVVHKLSRCRQTSAEGGKNSRPPPPQTALSPRAVSAEQLTSGESFLNCWPLEEPFFFSFPGSKAYIILITLSPAWSKSFNSDQSFHINLSIWNRSVFSVDTFIGNFTHGRVRKYRDRLFATFPVLPD